jgi:hypothetical protein
MNKPSEKDAKICGLSRKKMLCARKGKFGLNMQAVSDCRGRIRDMSINYGGASADCIAFEASDLFNELENGLLHPSLSLDGDNAYLNKSYMETPFPNVSGGGEDVYNFYHSQLQIRIECCFGQLFITGEFLEQLYQQKYKLFVSFVLPTALHIFITFVLMRKCNVGKVVVPICCPRIGCILFLDMVDVSNWLISPMLIFLFRCI